MRRILITGAAGKLGWQMTRHFVAAGDTVIAVSRHREFLDALAGSLETLAGQVVSKTADLVDGGAADLAQRLSREGLLPDAVINNAVDISNQALDARGHPNRRQWQTEFDLAVIAPYDLVTTLAEVTHSPLKAVVNISSVYGVVARTPRLYVDPIQQSPIHYGTTKAAMLHLTKELAVRLAPRIRVNALSLAGIEGRVDEDFQSRYAQLCPMGRMLREDEIASSVAFLLSEGASMMTGQNMIIDGGWTLW